jgi:hypothetical protein
MNLNPDVQLMALIGARSRSPPALASRPLPVAAPIAHQASASGTCADASPLLPPFNEEVSRISSSWRSARSGSSAGAWRARRCRRCYFPGSSDSTTASVQVMSTLSPTLTFDNASLSCTFVLYFQLFGPVKVTDGTFMSIAAIVAVMVR